MKTCVHTMAFPDLKAAQAMEIVASIGYDGIDLICDDEYSCGVSLHPTGKELRALKKQASDCGLEIAALTPYVADIWVEGDNRRGKSVEELQRCIDTAAELGAGSVRIMRGNVRPDDNEWAGAFNRAVDSLRRLAEKLPDGVHLNMENHANSMSTNSEETMKLVEAVNDPGVGVLYDPTNLYLYGEPDFRQAFERQKKSIGHVHVKDFRLFPGGNFCPVLMGEGDVPWRQLVSWLAAVDYRHYLSMEYEVRWHPGMLPNAPMALRSELATIKGYIAESKSLAK